MADVTENQDQAGVELSAADEQLLRELTERARAEGLKLTGEGGLLGKLTKMVIEWLLFSKSQRLSCSLSGPIVGGHRNLPAGGHHQLPGDGQPDHGM